MTTDLTKAKTASTPSFQEREAHREWIGGRAITLLSHYWRDDDPVELTAAIGRDWADVLEGIPQELIQKACIAYQRKEPRKKPTPGAIYQMARELTPRPKQARVDLIPDSRPFRERVSKEAAQQIVAAAGFAPKRIVEKKAETDDQ
jgi:hypothetical protein